MTDYNTAHNLRAYDVLVILSSDAKEKARSESVHEFTIPRWPPRVASVAMDDLTYQLAEVPFTSIVLVTNQMHKVCVNGVLINGVHGLIPITFRLTFLPSGFESPRLI